MAVRILPSAAFDPSPCSLSNMLIIQQQPRLPLPTAAGLPVAGPQMIAFFRNWRKRNKSLLRSSSGPCYPYPRVHSTVMVVPSNRPIATEEQEEKKPQPRRRPPLNRAIPTIPESKSNESIMSHASRVSTAPDPTTSTTDCVVIENRGAVERLAPVSKRETAMMRRSEVVKEKTTPRSPLLTVAHTMREKLSKLTRRKSPSTAGVKNSQSFSGFRGAPPPPPPVDENSNRVIKSFSMEATLISDQPSTSRPLKVVIPQLPEPLCGDEPSEELEPSLPSSTLSPSDSAVVKVSMKADVLTVVSKAPEEPTREHPSIEEREDVTSTGPSTTTEVIVAERPRELPVSVIYQQERVEVVKTEQPIEFKKDDNKENRPAKQVTTLIITSKKVEAVKTKRSISPDESKSPERYVMTVKTPESQRKHRTFAIGERNPETVLVEESVDILRVEPLESTAKPEEPKVLERFVMTVKTPEAQRKHHTFAVGEKDQEAVVVEEVMEKEKKESKKKESRWEEAKSPERYVMTVKSPEPQKKNRVYMVGPKTEDVVDVFEEEKQMKETKVKRTESRESSKSPERYILNVKTPETLRKHRVLTIGEGAPKERKIVRSKSEERSTLKIWTNLRKQWTLRRTQTFSTSDVRTERMVEKRISFAERPKYEDEKAVGQKDKFVLVVKTPQALRRHHTFMVGERPRTPDVPWIEEGELTEPIATVGPSATRARKTKEKRTRSEEPRASEREEGGERFVLTARTPLTMRKYQTFVVESKTPLPTLPTSASADVAEKNRRGDELIKELDAIYPISSRLESREFSSSASKEFYPFTQESPRRMTTSEMYSLTSTTPQLKRKEEVSSPTLFVLNRRSERPLEDDKRLEAVKEASQSDKAELRSPSVDDLTSLEDDIPMDTGGERKQKPVVSLLTLTTRPVPSPKTGRKKKKNSIRSQTQSQRGQDHRLLRGLRIFFMNKNRKPATPSSISTVTSNVVPSRLAPLAQSESTVVANSPLVENLPIEAWNTPRPRCSPLRAYSLIREEVNDANGNPQQEDNCPQSPQLLHRGLIDDEILDQPMLVGDSFSHSESSDHLSERAVASIEPQQQGQRRADVAPTQHIPPPVRSENYVEEGLSQVGDIKKQLRDLQTLINEHNNESASLDVASLAAENDALRRQLQERDQLIEQLRNQLTQLRSVPV